MNPSRIHLRATLGCCAALTTLFAGAAASHAQCSFLKLQPSDLATNDFFGGALSLSHEPGGVPVCAMGMAADDSVNGLNAGSVRFGVKAGSSWLMLPILTLTAIDGVPNDSFGSSVSYDYPALAVGATGVGPNGAVYTYRRAGSGWNLDNRVDAPSGGTNGEFGWSVGVSGDWMVVGEPFKSTPLGNADNQWAGAVHFYQRQLNGLWTFQQTEQDADNTNAEHHAELGYSVSISGDVCVVGMPGSKAPLYNAPDEHGAIHIYRKSIFNAWISETPSSFGYTDAGIQPLDQFGTSVSTDGATIAVGAPGDSMDANESPNNVAKQHSGCVYMLRYVPNGQGGGAWQPDGKIFAPDATDLAGFGGGVSVVGNRVAIAARGKDGGGAQKAYIFTRTAAATWTLDARLTDPDSANAPIDGFGSCITFDGTNILVGDNVDNENGLSNSGAVYAAAPSATGDPCSNPIPFVGSSMTGCTTFATTDIKASCDNGANDSPDVWYSWTPSCSGNAIIDTVGSAFDTILSVHSSCPSGVLGGIFSTHTITCNDDASGFGHDSLVTLDYVAGTTYLIRVGGYNGAKGDFNLRINQWQSPSNDSCSSPITVTSGNAYTFSNCKATTDSGVVGTCMAHGVNDVWYRFTPSVTGVLNIDTCGSNFDTILALYNTGTCPTQANGATQVACNDDIGAGHPCGHLTSAISTTILGGFPYLIRIAGYDTGLPIGDGVLNLSFVPNCPADFNQNGVLNVQDIFDFLGAWFAADPRANFNGVNGLSVQDIFDFLGAWFAGCP